MAVSRFFCFAILNAFRKNKKWRSSQLWRATHRNTLGGYMRGSPPSYLEMGLCGTPQKRPGRGPDVITG